MCTHLGRWFSDCGEQHLGMDGVRVENRFGPWGFVLVESLLIGRGGHVTGRNARPYLPPELVKFHCMYLPSYICGMCAIWSRPLDWLKRSKTIRLIGQAVTGSFHSIVMMAKRSIELARDAFEMANPIFFPGVTFCCFWHRAFSTLQQNRDVSEESPSST